MMVLKSCTYTHWVFCVENSWEQDVKYSNATKQKSVSENLKDKLRGVFIRVNDTKKVFKKNKNFIQI